MMVAVLPEIFEAWAVMGMYPQLFIGGHILLVFPWIGDVTGI